MRLVVLAARNRSLWDKFRFAVFFELRSTANDSKRCKMRERGEMEGLTEAEKRSELEGMR
jgi:hypothetical protein